MHARSGGAIGEGVQGGRSCRRFVVSCLVYLKKGSSLEEGGEHSLGGDDGGDRCKALGEAAEDGEDESLIANGVVEVAKSISERLHLLAVLQHREIALRGVAKVGFQREDTDLVVVAEEAVVSHPDRVCH